MQEIYRSRSMASLVMKKQFLEDNDIPCRIFSEDTDITDMPSHPVFGLSYRLEEPAILIVDDEDVRRAWALLNNVENPVGDEDDYPYEEKDDDIDASFPDDKNGSLLLKIIFGVLFAGMSVVWLYYATIFLSAIWTSSPGARDSLEDTLLIPIGMVMIVIWLFFLLLIITRLRNKD